MRMKNQNDGPGAAATARGTGFASFHSRLASPTAEQATKARATSARLRLMVRGPAGPFTVTGQVAEALAELVSCGPRGVTALEVNSWAYQLGAYVHTLRHNYGLAIETVHKGHEGGWHARYRLLSPVSIIGRAA